MRKAAEMPLFVELSGCFLLQEMGTAYHVAISARMGIA